MKYERLFDLSAWLIVVVLHIAGLWWQAGARSAQLTIGAPGMQLVSLGDLDVGKAAAAAPPKLLEAAPEFASESEPQPEAENKILAMDRPEEKPDIAQKPKPEPKPKAKLKPKSKSKSKPKSKPKSKSNAGSRADSGSATSSTRGERHGLEGGTGKAGSRRYNSQGGGQTGGGQGARAATHLGGHLRNPKPPYPALSIENGEQGTVRLRVVVESDGRPSSVQLAKSSGYSRLDRSALRTVRYRYRFVPATRMGRPVRSVYTFNIVFSLDRR